MLPGIPVHLVVVADACTDRTAGLARRGRGGGRRDQARSVGAAAGRACGRCSAGPGTSTRAAVWLATTDADTLVPPDWLGQHLRHAAAGWDAVVGTVTVTDWGEHPPGLPPLFHQQYRTGRGTHPHVHGANLGFSAECLPRGGRVPARAHRRGPRPRRALTAAGRRVLRTTEITVVTSARRHARAPHGFSHLLSTLAVAQPDPVAQPGL